MFIVSLRAIKNLKMSLGGEGVQGGDEADYW